MKTLYEYMCMNVDEGAVLDFFSELIGIFKDFTSSTSQAIRSGIDLKKEIRTDRSIQHQHEVERILLYMLKDDEFVQAIRDKEDDIYLRRMLQNRLKKKDIKYIPDIINYINSIREKVLI